MIFSIDIIRNKSIIDADDPDTLQDIILDAINMAIEETTNKKNKIADSIAPGLGSMF